MSSLLRNLSAAEEAFVKGDLARAARVLKRVLVAAPAHSRANELMAYVNARNGDEEGAFARLSAATRSPGATATAWYYFGVARRKRNEHDHAVAAFRRALEIDPRLFPAWHDMGLSQLDLKLFHQAVESFKAAAAKDPQSVEALHNLGCALHAIGSLDEALQCYERALELNPEYPPTWFNRAETLHDLRRYDEAIAGYERARALGYEPADVDWNLSLTLLLRGELAKGWQKYEARWQGPRAWKRRHQGIAPWSGKGPVDGMRLLLWSEQGLGDTLQFCRYAPLLAQRGARVVLEVQPALKGLLSRLPGCEVIAQGEDAGRCDAQMPLLSLPLAFGTAMESIPASVPYLNALPDRVIEWKSRLGPRTLRPRIAVAYTGRATQKDDAYRSLPVEELDPLREVADLVITQVEVRAQDRPYLESHRDSVRSLEREIVDFEDSAAIVENVDLVLTIDTSLAHLAGALGRPVWIMLPWTPTWRWLAEREDSPWYPTARLFRQQRRGDWKDVVTRVAQALAARGQSCMAP